MNIRTPVKSPLRAASPELASKTHLRRAGARPLLARPCHLGHIMWSSTAPSTPACLLLVHSARKSLHGGRSKHVLQVSVACMPAAALSLDRVKDLLRTYKFNTMGLKRFVPNNFDKGRPEEETDLQCYGWHSHSFHRYRYRSAMPVGNRILARRAQVLKPMHPS